MKTNLRRQPLIWVSFVFAMSFFSIVFSGCGGENSDKPIKFPAVKPYSSTEIAREDFVGAAVCGGCHEAQYLEWKESTHGKAGGEPDAVKIIAKFDGQPLRFKDATVTPLKRDGKYFFAIEPNGQPTFEIPVVAVVGGGHMVGGGTQTFFVQAPDGTMRFLPFDFSRHRGIWFAQLRDNLHWMPISENIALTDLANWPPHRMLGSLENYSNCQNCHASQVTVALNAETQRYETEYTSLSINCESCHGPGKQHVILMNQPGHETFENIGLNSLSTLSKDASLELCFRCHAIKDELQPGYIDGKPLEDYFSLKLPLLAEEQHTVDGRVIGFSYQENHLFSDCYINGSMTCVDCHSPHSLNYRDNFGKPLASRFDDGQCTGCHPSYIDSPEHTKHPMNSDGSRCVHCHMPYLQEKGVGSEIPYARSDHTIAIPRPAFDASIGLENACQKCHQNMSIDQLEAKTREWYGDLKPRNAVVQAFIDALNIRDHKTAADLLLQPDARHPIAQVRSLFVYIRRFLRAQMSNGDPVVIDKLRQLAHSTDVDLKAFSLMALHFGYGNNLDVRQFLHDQLAALGAQDFPVRRRWVLGLDYLGTQYFLNNDLQSAIVCYQKALDIQPDEYFVLLNLAQVFRQLPNISATAECYEKLIELKPQSISLYLELSDVYLQNGQAQRARETVENGLRISPDNPDLQQQLTRIERQLSN